MAKTYRLRVCFKGDKSRIVPMVFDSQKKARAYAIQMMDADMKISHFLMSNPNYMDVWQLSWGIYRTHDRGGYYWSALYPFGGWQTGSGHYINKDGSLSKKAYKYYAKDW